MRGGEQNIGGCVSSVHRMLCVCVCVSVGVWDDGINSTLDFITFKSKNKHKLSKK